MSQNNNSAGACTVCGRDSLIERLDFGEQPPANAFVSHLDDKLGKKYSLSLGFCSLCGTTQLVKRIPIDAFRPKFDWLVYNEPEGHLDDVATYLTTLEGITGQSSILGTTYKDQSTLDRLTNLGFSKQSVVDVHELDCEYACFGLETIQAQLSRLDIVEKIIVKHGRVDLLLVRHVLEHATSAVNFLHVISQLVSPRGYVVLEIPDSQKIFDTENYPFIWEEHLSYFIEGSAAQLANAVGAELVTVRRYPYAFEDSLVIVLRMPTIRTETRYEPKGVDVEKVDFLLQRFSDQFSAKKHEWRFKLKEIHARGKKIALFGAGHLSAKFINFLELSDLIDCVIDDHPQKVGMYMPGSLLPIVSSAELLTRGIRYCISTLSPESEEKVRKKLALFFQEGGVFLPAFNTEVVKYE